MNLLNFWISLDNVKCRDKETTEPRQIPNSGFRLGILTVASETGFPSSTPSCQLRLKARVDLGDQTAEFIPFEVISTAILTYFYLLLGTNVRILVSAINTRFNRMRQDGVH